MIDIQRWSATDMQNGAGALADILHACVHDDASVGFILPHPPDEALAFWRGDILDQVRQGHRALLVARDGARAGKTLLTLDTRSGDSAEPLYRSLGFETAGMIPGYCLDVTGRRFDSTIYMYKQLDPYSG